MRAFMGKASNLFVGLLVLAVVAGVGYYFVFAKADTKKVTVQLPSAVGIYPGTPVDILGIQVGKVDSVKPQPGYVKVVLSYAAKYKVPATAGLVVVANSLVSDRYLQLTPAYSGGPVMADGATIHMDHTSSPAELDDIYAALNKLSVDLGPNGVNKNGALSRLLKVSAANLDGNGVNLGASTEALSKAVQTLANGRGDLFSTVNNLKKFNDALTNSDKNVRSFENLLASVSTSLAQDRTELGAALHNLTVALQQVSDFVKNNANAIHTDVLGLKDITGLLVKDKSSLDEILAVAPVALANLVHAYQENTGTLGTRSNLTEQFQDPANLCGIFNSIGVLTNNLLGNITSDVANYCLALAQGGTTLPVLPGSLQTQLKNVLPAMPGAS